jgi:predicted DNA-binding protein
MRKSRFSNLTDEQITENVAKVTGQENSKEENVPLRKRGRPQNTRIAFTSSLEPEVRTKLDLLAASKRKSLSDVLHEILEYYFENVEDVALPVVKQRK